MNEYEIRADYDSRSITVYQAYGAAIALPALHSQRFVAPFSLNRMIWIKPSFLWLMESNSHSFRPLAAPLARLCRTQGDMWCEPYAKQSSRQWHVRW